MSGNSINFGDKKINKINFYKSRKPFKIDDIDVNKILVLKKRIIVKKSSKYFIGYSDVDNVIRLCIKLPQMIGYVKHFDSNKARSFKVTDNELLKKYCKLWEKLSSLMNIKFDSEPVYGDNDKYINTKIKLYEDKINKSIKGKKKYQKKMHHINVYH